MPARLLLLCLPLRSSWLTVEAGRQVGAADCCIAGAGRGGWWRSKPAVSATPTDWSESAATSLMQQGG
jgi:hypothetical protein